MRRLPSQLQLGLHIASCLGHCVKSFVIDILSMEFCTNLPILLRLVSEKGFLKHDSGDSSFSFVHDKIQQAAKELMSEQQRLELHMQLGLAICSSTLEIGQNDELFFMSVNQSKTPNTLCSDNCFCVYPIYHFLCTIFLFVSQLWRKGCAIRT